MANRVTCVAMFTITQLGFVPAAQGWMDEAELQSLLKRLGDQLQKMETAPENISTFLYYVHTICTAELSGDEARRTVKDSFWMAWHMLHNTAQGFTGIDPQQNVHRKKQGNRASAEQLQALAIVCNELNICFWCRKMAQVRKAGQTPIYSDDEPELKTGAECAAQAGKFKTACQAALKGMEPARVQPQEARANAVHEGTARIYKAFAECLASIKNQGPDFFNLIDGLSDAIFSLKQSRNKRNGSAKKRTNTSAMASLSASLRARSPLTAGALV